MKSTVLEENLDDNYEPTTLEIHEYARFLGMDPDEDKDLLWIAKESLKAPLPENWKPCQTEEGDIYYFNFKSGESLWDHPCDNHYRELFKREKTKKTKNESIQDSKGVTKISNSTLAPIISNRNISNDSQRKTVESLPAITSLQLKDLNQEDKKLAGLLKLKSNSSISALSPIKVGQGEEMNEGNLGRELEQVKLENSLEIQKIKDKHLEAKRELELLQEKELKSLEKDLEMRKLEIKERLGKEYLDYDLEKEKNKLLDSQEFELKRFERDLKEKLETERKKLLLEFERELEEKLEFEKRELKERLETENERELKDRLDSERKDYERELKDRLESEKKKLLLDYENG